MTEQQIKLITELYESIQANKNEVKKLYKENAFKHLRTSSIRLYDILIFHFGEGVEIDRKNPHLCKIIYDEHCMDFAGVIREWEKRGFCIINKKENKHGTRIQSFSLINVL